jgi:hypothetical protein
MKRRAAQVVLLAAALTVITALGLPAPAWAADAPARLDDLVSQMARSEVMGSVTSARYLATTADAAAVVLGTSRTQFTEGTPERVYLVELQGSFSPQGMGQSSGPYLAFVYWPTREGSIAIEFTVLQEPLQLDSLRVPQVIEPLALAHPRLDQAWLVTREFVYRFLAPILLVASAIFCAWRRSSLWPYAVTACVALAVAGWQIAVMLGSLEGRPWDPFFHGIKVGILVIVVGVDLAAAGVALRVLRRRRAADKDGLDRPRWLSGSIVLPVVAAVLYLATLSILSSSGE